MASQEHFGAFDKMDLAVALEKEAARVRLDASKRIVTRGGFEGLHPRPASSAQPTWARKSVEEDRLYAERLESEAMRLRQEAEEEYVRELQVLEGVSADAAREEASVFFRRMWPPPVTQDRDRALLSVQITGRAPTRGAGVRAPRHRAVAPAATPSASSPTPPSPAASFAAESKKIDGLVKGSAAVGAPNRAKAGDWFPVYLRVSPEHDLGAVIQGLMADYPDNQTVKGKRDVKLTPRMTATVSGGGFEVDPKAGQTQAVSATEPTTWPWRVRATESGLLTLTFALSGALNIEGKDVERTFYVYRQQVQVEVSPMGFVEKYWQWFVTTLAIPAAGALWAVFRKPKDSDGVRKPSLAEALRERRRLRATA